jgi:hypothetical protein
MAPKSEGPPQGWDGPSIVVTAAAPVMNRWAAT